MKLVILDRDGVINVDSDQFIKSPAEWKPLAGSVESIAQLNHAGYRVVIATNQSGIGRGLFDMGTLAAINDKMMETVFRAGGRIDAVFLCPHTADENCPCRKPKTGMFDAIKFRYHLDHLKDVPAVGDSPRDLQAAFDAGAQPVLVLTGKGKKTKEAGGLPKGTQVFESLADFTKQLVARAAKEAKDARDS